MVKTTAGKGLADDSLVQMPPNQVKRYSPTRRIYPQGPADPSIDVPNPDFDPSLQFTVPSDDKHAAQRSVTWNSRRRTRPGLPPARSTLAMAKGIKNSCKATTSFCVGGLPSRKVENAMQCAVFLRSFTEDQTFQ